MESHNVVSLVTRHYGSGDIIVLVCDIISQDDVIKVSCDFMDSNPLM